MPFVHESVLLKETIDALNIREDGIYVDCTLGAGGHSAAILQSLKTGHLYCFDQDRDAIAAASGRLSAISDHFTIIASNFKYLKRELHARGVDKVDGILFDLGVSSPQFDTPERGFSYNYDAKLDMRMDQSQTLTAYDVVNSYSYERLVGLLYKNAQEKYAKSIARAIERERQKKPIETTFELAEIVKTAIPAKARRTGGHPAKRTFQAIRIEVNDELNVFETALNDAIDLLALNGRIAVITFHSLEDKICKHTFTNKTKSPDLPKNIPVVASSLEPQFRKVTRKPIIADHAELERNRRSHSAKLRVIERAQEDISHETINQKNRQVDQENP